MHYALAIALTFIAIPALAASYAYTSLDTPGQTAGAATAVNDAGQVIGTYQDSAGQHAYVWQAAQFTPITGFGSRIVPTAINARGVVVGSYVNTKGEAGAFRYDASTQKVRTIHVPGNYAVMPAAINRNGAMLLNIMDVEGLLKAQGSTTILLPPGAKASAAIALNDRGLVGGYWIDQSLTKIGFVYQDRAFTTVSPPSNDGFATVTAVSKSGAIGGTFWGPPRGDDVGFSLENANYTYFRYPGAYETELVAYGQPGQVVGNYNAAPPYGGFNWVSGTYYRIDPFSAPTVRITGASANGSITGTYTDGADVVHGFVGFCPTGQGVCTQ